MSKHLLLIIIFSFMNPAIVMSDPDLEGSASDLEWSIAPECELVNRPVVIVARIVKKNDNFLTVVITEVLKGRVQRGSKKVIWRAGSAPPPEESTWIMAGGSYVEELEIYHVFPEKDRSWAKKVIRSDSYNCGI